jgi:hypothetical protein
MKKYIFGAVLIISSVSYAPPKNKRTSSNTASNKQNEIDSAGICGVKCFLDVFEKCPSARETMISILLAEMWRRNPEDALKVLESLKEETKQHSDKNSKK